MFIYLVYFEFILVWSVREYSNFILLHVAVQFSEHQLLKLSLVYILASFVVYFSSCLQSFPASGSLLMSWLLLSSSQSIGASASASVLPMNIQGWFSLEFTGLISFQPKELSRVFTNTTVQKHQFFGAQPSSGSNSHIHMWLLEKM